ncbi:MAG: ABC transporter ATP-binding protein [Candidatus Aminicenantes bacterium]|nr:ABC transporter ATP-binding protein [Candidatus Aminicenantes bacterium]
MSGDTVIRVEGIGKKYRLGSPTKYKYKALRDVIAGLFTAPFRVKGKDKNKGNDSIWALKDVSFEVKKGEVVGIIGRNGAGKTTLLKILSRITPPTEGYAEIQGRIGSLLEVGTGFHPELTGRENIYLSGAILGMKKREIDKNFDEIVAFSELEKFLDTPVKYYSSGMYVRLAFAVAAHLEPEILLVDEVLAVGDAAFQKKCLGKMGDVAREGRTVLFVSHNMGAISALCSRVLLLANGQLLEEGSARQVVQNYLLTTSKVFEVPLGKRTDREGSGDIKACDIRFGTSQYPNSGKWMTGADCYVEVDLICKDSQPYANVEVALGIRRLDESHVLYLGTKVTNQNFDVVGGSATIVCDIPRLPLEPGEYYVITEISRHGDVLDKVDRAARLEVLPGDFYGTGVIWPYGGFLCDYSWRFRVKPAGEL